VVELLDQAVGGGIFTWEGEERRSKRYGYFFFHTSTYDNTATAHAYLNDLSALVGQRVHVKCQVLESRKSGHAGDAAINLLPTRPRTHEIVDLGVGLLHLKREHGFPTPEIGLLPGGDGRADYWIDPALFRLHDQTVSLFVEPTDADFTPAVYYQESAPGATVNSDGTFQVSRIKLSDIDRIVPHVTSHGGGLFTVDTQFQPGERLNVIRKRS
jgi:hypothetical protein